MDIRATDVVIVGCGPAGLAAAIQLKRSGLEPVVFERERIGGLLVNAHLVENYPGFPDGISGLDLTALMEKHLKRRSVDVTFDEVVMVDTEGDGFLIKGRESTIRSKFVAVASGTRPKELASLRVPERVRDKVTYEIYPLRAVPHKRIVIVGAGDAAFDYALSLEQHNDVTILNRHHVPRCMALLWERARMSTRISYVANTELVGIDRAPRGELALTCRNPERSYEVTADYVVIAIGRQPALGFLSARLEETAEAKRKQGLLHLIGDVRTGSMRQTAIAVGDGIMAAMKITDKLREMGR